jgi:3-methyladenine DNA glycosylase/8-oxoguanine DNA glycosylase
VERRFEAPRFYDLDESLRFLPLGSHDPTCRRGSGVVWKAGRTPLGPVTLELRRETAAIRARGFGPGADWAVERAAALLGLHDHPAAFTPPPGRLGILARRGRGLHLPRSPFVFDALTGAILQQRIAWRDATRAHRRLTAALGERAPGPPGLKLPLSARQWLALSGEDFRRAEVDGQRARALRAAARQAQGVDSAFDRSLDEARAVLSAVPGCGPWTVEMTMAFGLGDPDAVILGDLHIPRLVAWALAGEALERGVGRRAKDGSNPSDSTRETEADDARMLALLEPYRGHRFRLIRLLYAAGIGTSISSRSRASLASRSR